MGTGVSKAGRGGGGGGGSRLSGEVDFEQIVSASQVSVDFSLGTPVVIDSRNPNASLVYDINGKNAGALKKKFPNVKSFNLQVREGRQKDNAMKAFSELGYKPQAWYKPERKHMSSYYYMVKK